MTNSSVCGKCHPSAPFTVLKLSVLKHVTSSNDGQDNYPTRWSQNKRILVCVCCGECSLKLVVSGVEVGLLRKENFWRRTTMQFEKYRILENINQCDV